MSSARNSPKRKSTKVQQTETWIPRPAPIKLPKSGRICTVEGCTKQVQQGGVCCKHGAKTSRASCYISNCTNVAKRGGLCRRHGAFKLEGCHIKGCKRVAREGTEYCNLHDEDDGLRMCKPINDMPTKKKKPTSSKRSQPSQSQSRQGDNNKPAKRGRPPKKRKVVAPKSDDYYYSDEDIIAADTSNSVDIGSDEEQRHAEFYEAISPSSRAATRRQVTSPEMPPMPSLPAPQSIYSPIITQSDDEGDINVGEGKEKKIEGEKVEYTKSPIDSISSGGGDNVDPWSILLSAVNQVAGGSPNDDEKDDKDDKEGDIEDSSAVLQPREDLSSKKPAAETASAVTTTTLDTSNMAMVEECLRVATATTSTKKDGPIIPSLLE